MAEPGPKCIDCWFSRPSNARSNPPPPEGVLCCDLEMTYIEPHWPACEKFKSEKKMRARLAPKKKKWFQGKIGS